MAMYSRSSVQNFDNQWFWIRKNKHIASFDKIYLYAKDLSEHKYEFLIKKHKNLGTEHLNNSKAFNECSNTIDDVYEKIDDYNPSRERKILIVFDGMIADIMSNKKFQAIIKELFIRCRKLNISLCLSLSLIFLFQKMLD